MASTGEEIAIKIKTAFDGADISKQLKQMSDKVADAYDKFDKVTDRIGKFNKSVKNTASSVAGGIGLFKAYEAALGFLKDAFMGNAESAEFISGIMEGLKVIFNEVVGVIVDVVKEVSASTNGFEGLSAVVGGVLTIALKTLAGTFYTLELAILKIRKVWEESPFGEKDPKTIKELNANIEETSDKLVKIGDDIIKAGKSVGQNIGKAIDEIATVVDKSIEGIEKIDTKAAMAKGKRIASLKATAVIAEAVADKAAAKFERDAEKQRQLRDDDTKSIKERQAANEKLATILDDQEKAMKAAALANVAAAKAELASKNSAEGKAAVIKAEAAYEQVIADIEGKRSEQKQNEVNLKKEALELSQLEIQAEVEIGQKQRENSTSRIKDDVERMTQEKADLEVSKTNELQRLQSVIDAAAEGTKARAEAEKEFGLKKAEFDKSIADKTDEINKTITEKTKTRIENEIQAFVDGENRKIEKLAAGSPKRIAAERNLLVQQLAEYQKHKSTLFKTDEEYEKKKKELEGRITKSEKDELEARRNNAIAIVQEILNVAGQIASSVGNYQQTLAQNRMNDLKNQQAVEVENFERNKEATIERLNQDIESTKEGTKEREEAVKRKEAAEKNFVKTKLQLDKKLQEQERVLAKEAFEQGKRLSIVQTIIAGAQAVVAALAGAKNDPTGGVLTAIQVAAVIATTAIQLATIKAQQFNPGPGGGGGGEGSLGGMPAPPSVPIPSTMGLGEAAIRPEKQQANWQKVYVVESDIRNVTGRVEVIENRSVLGS